MHETFKDVIVPEFKKRGYKRKGKTFIKKRGGLVEICNVQFSRFNYRTTASFTYNIRIAIPSLYDLLGIQYADKLKTVIFDSSLERLLLGRIGYLPLGIIGMCIQKYIEGYILY